MKERLEAAKVASARNANGSNQGTFPGFNLGGAGSRIAKPLRGGGGGGGGGGLDMNGNTSYGGAGPNFPVISGLQAQQANGNATSPKRSSWFFSDRR